MATAKATATLMSMAICGRPNCTFTWNHNGACSYEFELGKRVRRPRVFHEGMQPLEAGDSPKQAGGRSRKKTNKSTAEVNTGAGASTEDDLHMTRDRPDSFWPHLSTGAPRPQIKSDVVIPNGVDLAPGTIMGSAEVKIMNLTAQKRTKEGRADIATWGGSITVPCGELDAINHNRQADNTDVIIISCRDPLTGDVYVYRHLTKS